MDHTNQPDEKNYWEKLGILYDQASLLVGDERTTFLKTNCKDDSLRAELESLLQVHDASARYFESLSDSLLGQAIDRMSDMPPDEEIIGKYRITGKIGRGGMGTVYLGERADETFDKKVAIKVLRRGLDSEDILSRFRAERQILARLNHPNITHMIDGGITSQGRPWFVMEYVDGVPITQYCDDNKLNLEKRLELFTVVCDAVQYAHQNLVIHRDLKPSNILVTPDGHIKLLDFGIAKVLDDPDSTDPHTRFTRAGFRPLTPAFASPEQFSGEPVSTASDVYSLGVLLYLLLTGRLPYQQKPDSFPDSDVFKNRQDPPLPSKAITAPNTDPSGRSSLPARLDSARLEKQLSGDLDTILLTALRIDPSRRYTTAKALADDIRNHLTGHPVVARPDGWQYRAGKFIGRHKTGVAVAVLLPLMIITGLYLHGEQLEKERDLARTAAERAELEAAKAQEVSVFLTGLFRSADPFETAEELTSIELLERGREQLSELDEHTEVSAEMSAVLGNIYYRLGRYDEADELFTRAIGVRYNKLGYRDIPTARMLSDYGLVLDDTDRLADADSLYQLSLDIIRENTGEVSSEASNLYHNLAALYNKMSRFDEAEAKVGRAIDIRREVYGGRSLEVASSLHQLGVIQNRRSRFNESLESFGEALDIRLELIGDEHPQTLFTLGGIAGSQSSLGEIEEAEQTYLRILDIRRRLFGNNHPDVATTLYQIGITHWHRNDYEQARYWWEQALDVRREVFGPHHSSVALTINALAALSWRVHDLEHALEMLTEAEQIYRAIHGDEHQQVALIINNRATTVSELGRLDEAEDLYREALAMRIRLMGENHDETANTIRSLGRMITLDNRWDEAEELMLRALAAYEAIYPDDHAEVIETRDLLDRIRTRREEYLAGLAEES